jgi:hypothetical protein
MNEILSYLLESNCDVRDFIKQSHKIKFCCIKIENFGKKAYLLEHVLEEAYLFELSKIYTPEEIQLLISSLFDATRFSIRNKSKQSRLHWITMARNNTRLRLKVKHPQELLEVDVYGNTPMHYALIHQNTENVDMFSHSELHLTNASKVPLWTLVKKRNLTQKKYFQIFVKQVKITIHNLELSKHFVRKINTFID